MQADFWELELQYPSRRDTPVALMDFAAALARLGPPANPLLQQVRARAGFGRSHLLELVIGVPWNTVDDAAVLTAVEELLALQLGEEVLDAWVGAIDVTPIASGGRLRVLQQGLSAEAFEPLETLAPTLISAVSALRQGLPDLPCYQRCDHEPWVMFELTPELDVSGYLAHPLGEETHPLDEQDTSSRIERTAPQCDLVTATTWMPEMLRCLLRGDPFYSGRFTRRAERFYYVELEDAELPQMERLERRVALEDALNATLQPLELGCVVGGGIGLLRSYVDLALVNPMRALAPLMRVVEQGDLNRAWLRAADSEYAAQRLALHDD